MHVLKVGQFSVVALASHEHLGKTVLRSPVDGVVNVIAAEIGENVRAGQPVLTIAATGKQWLSFNMREDFLRGLTVGTTVEVLRAGMGKKTSVVVAPADRFISSRDWTSQPHATKRAWIADRALSSG
jgi:multidrug resistance efflux pump